MSTEKVNVVITCDVECWPQSERPLPVNLNGEVGAHIYGKTKTGEELGINWQMDVLNQHGLRGVFFVEALCATRAFHDDLQRVVESIQTKGHDVELHAHTEWFHFPPIRSLIGNKCKQFLKDYSLVEQAVIIKAAKSELERCGAEETVAFRAGNFGGNQDTLCAVKEAGILIDSSYNAVHLGGACSMEFDETRNEPFLAEGVWEYPVTCFRDKPILSRNHLRPLQVTATSFREMSSVLWESSRLGMDTVVILTHSFEMTHFTAGSSVQPRKNRLNVSRFRCLCRFLEDNSHVFRVTTFKEIVRHGMIPGPGVPNGELPASKTMSYVIRGIQNLSSNLLRY